MLTKAYYSDDDGKTWFADDINKEYPFNHNGRPAYRAFIFRYPDGSSYCGYLQRLSANAVKRVNELRGKGSGQEINRELVREMSTGAEVKKPGQAAWVPLQTGEANIVVTARAHQEHGGMPEIVMP